MVNKVIIGIFISILSIFAMSYNANALDINYEYYDIVRNADRPSLECGLQSGQTSTGSRCSFNGESGTMLLKYIRTPVINNLKAGDIVEFYILINNRGNNVFNGGIAQLMTYNAAPDMLTLDIQEVDDFDQLKYTVLNENLPGENVGYVSDFWTNLTFGKVYKVQQKVLKDGNYNIGFDVSQYSSSNYFIFQWIQLDDYLIDFTLRNLIIYRPTESKENKEVEEKTQGAVDQSTTDGNNSQSTVEGSTQSLMTAGSTILGALVSAPATDCNISLQTTGNSRLFTTAIGQLNLCSDVPSGVLTMVQGIVALVFTPIVLYFTYNVLTTLYNQFKEYNS